MDKFVKTFLYTHQSFATPDRLLRKLLERYNVVRPEGMSPQGFAVMKQTIQACVINALKLWVELSVDFKGELAIIMMIGSLETIAKRAFLWHNIEQWINYC